MTLNKLEKFSETREAATYTRAIKARCDGAARFLAAQPAPATPHMKHSVAKLA